MAINKVIYGDDTLMDITDTTAETGDVISGKTFYAANGVKTTGTASIPQPATAAPLEDGTATVGVSVKYAREDHIHPADSAKVNISDLLDLVYPIGAIYISVDETEPGLLFGGNWARITGRFLLAATDDGSSGASQAAGNTGGEATHTLIEGELPSISGNFDIVRAGNSTSNTTTVRATSGKFTVTRNASAATSISVSAQTPTVTSYKPDRVAFAFGSGNAHNNMPPYLSVYVWKRLPDENT